MPERLFTWVTPIRCAALPAIQATLKEIGDDRGGNRWLPFSQLPMLHFASLTLFAEQRDDRAATLVFEHNIDRPADDYVNELVRVCRSGLDRIYGECAGYPGVEGTPAAVVEFLSRQEKRPQLYHIGHPDRTIQEIRGDHELRRSIEHELSVVDPALKDRDPAQIVATIRSRANCPSLLTPRRRPWHPTWDHPASADPTPLEDIEWLPDEFDWQPMLRRIGLALIGVLIESALVVFLGWLIAAPRLATLTGATIVVAGIVYMSAQDTRVLRAIGSSLAVAALADAVFRWLPWFDPAHPPPWLAIGTAAVLVPTGIIVLSYVNIFVRLKVTLPLPVLDQAQRDLIRKLLDAEDRPEHSIYNHVAGLSIVKDRFRLVRVVRTWLALQFLNLFYRTYFVRGKLASIPSIHFAGWTLVDGHRLLFLTNYDDSADSYLDDFFNSLAGGVAFIWYDTVLFPGTKDPRLLKIWVRRGQTLASVRYRAPVYNALTVGLINNNTYIRRRLLRGRGSRSARRWLRRLATTPVEPSPLARAAAWLKGLVGSSAS